MARIPEPKCIHSIAYHVCVCVVFGCLLACLLACSLSLHTSRATFESVSRLNDWPGELNERTTRIGSMSPFSSINAMATQVVSLGSIRAFNWTARKQPHFVEQKVNWISNTNSSLGHEKFCIPGHNFVQGSSLAVNNTDGVSSLNYSLMASRNQFQLVSQIRLVALFHLQTNLLAQVDFVWPF